jgi:hypothetical protein
LAIRRKLADNNPTVIGFRNGLADSLDVSCKIQAETALLHEGGRHQIERSPTSVPGVTPRSARSAACPDES